LTSAEDSVENTTRVFARLLSAGVCLRHASTSLRYRGTSQARAGSSQAQARHESGTSHTPSPLTPDWSRATAPCFKSGKRALAPFLSRRFTLRSRSRVDRYQPIRQWVSCTRELALKSPLTASIQAEFNSRADIPVYQQSRVNRPQKCRHLEE
jgi:hypothetical protein